MRDSLAVTSLKMPVQGISLMDRYQLAGAFQTEQIRRAILNCDKADDLKTISLKLLQMCQNQKEMIADLLLP